MGDQRILRRRPRARLKAASNSSTDLETLRTLADDVDAAVRRTARARYWSRVLGSANAAHRLQAARSPGTQDTDLILLADDDDAQVQEAVAMRWASPSPYADASTSSVAAEVLVALAGKPSATVRAAVAANTGLPRPLVERLARDADPRVRAAVSGNHDTASQILDRLALDPDAGVRGAAAGNSTTPLGTRVRLAADPHPEVRRRLLEGRGQGWAGGLDRQFASALSSKDWEELARSEDEYVRAGVAGSSEAPARIVGLLSADPSSLVRKAVADNGIVARRDPEVSAQILARLVHDDSEDVRQTMLRRLSARLANRPSEFAPEELIVLARVRNLDIRQRVARLHELPAAVLLDLVRDPDEDVRASAARSLSVNFDVPPSALMDLVTSEDVEVRVAVALLLSAYSLRGRPGRLAQSREALVDVLRSLANDPCTRVREVVANNPMTPVQSLVALADDPEPSVRDEVARACPGADLKPEELAALARVKTAEVRASVVWNEGTPTDVVVALADDEDEVVRSAVVQALTPPDFSFEYDRSSKFDESALARLAAAKSQDVRASVARHKNASRGTLKILLNDDSPAVWEAIASNTGSGMWDLAMDETTTAAALRVLSTSDSSTTRSFVAGNPSSPADLLVGLARPQPPTEGEGDSLVRSRVASNPSAPAPLLASLAHDQSERVRKSVASNPATTREALAALAEDPKTEVRAAVAGNPSTPVEAMTLLAIDPAREVRQALVSSPSTPSELLADIAKNPSARTLDARSENERLQAALSARSPENPVDLALVKNRNTPADALADLALRYATPVPSGAASKYSSIVIPRGAPIFRMLGTYQTEDVVVDRMTPEVLHSDEVWVQGVRQALASHPNTPADTLVRLARDPDTASRVASNPSAPAAALRRLTYCRASTVRALVAANHSTPTDSLAILVLDEVPSVRSAVTANPASEEEIAKWALERWHEHPPMGTKMQAVEDELAEEAEALTEEEEPPENT